MERNLAASLCFWSDGALRPSLSQFQCLSFICDTSTRPQALGSAHGMHFLASISIPGGDAAPGVMPFPRRGAGWHTVTPHWTRTGHAVPQSLRDSFPPEQAWKLTLCFCKTPHPWVSPCSAGKPLESGSPIMAGGNSWKRCQHCAAEQGGPRYLWRTGVQQELSATGWSSVQAAKRFWEAPQILKASESHCRACTTNCASRLKKNPM